VLLLVAGTLIPARLGATGARLRSVLWLTSSAALAAFLGLGASEWSGWTGNGVVTFAALGTALYSAALWRAHRHLLQHVVVFAALLVGVGTAVSLLPDGDALLGLAVWGVSAAWFAFAWGGVIPDRQVGMVLGAIGMVMGAATLVDEGWGVVLALATVSALVGLALTFRDLFLLAAVVTTRRRGEAASGEEARWAIGTRRFGMLIAAVIVVATSAVVLVAGAS